MCKQVLRSVDPSDVMKRLRSRHTRQRPRRKQSRDLGNRRKVKEDVSTLYERRTQYSHSTESHVEQEQELIQPDSSKWVLPESMESEKPKPPAREKQINISPISNREERTNLGPGACERHAEELTLNQDVGCYATSQLRKALDRNCTLKG